MDAKKVLKKMLEQQQAQKKLPTRTTNKAVRSVGTSVFYVEEVQQQDEKGEWHTLGWQVQVKHYTKEPIWLDNWPSNEDLLKIHRWR